jgi:hypothetical protein
MIDCRPPNRPSWLIPCIAVLIATIGCDLPPDPTLAGSGLKSVPAGANAAGPPPPPRSPSPGISPDQPANVDSITDPVATTDAAEFDAAANQSAANGPSQTTSTSATAPIKPAVQLSAGVAVPQLLPEGTQIGVSVDYRVSGTLHPSARYALVIESGSGELALEVRLAAPGGTLQSFLPLAIRPEHQPFRARVEMLLPGESQPTKISNTANLQTNY